MFNTSEFINFRLKHLVEYDLNYLSPNDTDSAKKFSNYYSNYEVEAKKIYDSHDNIAGYLFEVITLAKQNSINHADKYYEKRLLDINECELAKETASKIDEFKLDVVNIRRRQVLFIRNVCEVSGEKEKELIYNSDVNIFTTNCFALHIARMISYFDKVMFIADFHNKMRDWFLYEALFERFNETTPNITSKRKPKPKLTFKELFRKQNEFYDILTLLESKDVIFKLAADDSYRFNNEMTINSRFSSKPSLDINETFVLVLARTLLDKNYFINVTGRQIVFAFQFFFNLKKLNEQKYSDIKINPQLYEVYSDSLKFIPAST